MTAAARPASRSCTPQLGASAGCRCPCGARCRLATLHAVATAVTSPRTPEWGPCCPQSCCCTAVRAVGRRVCARRQQADWWPPAVQHQRLQPRGAPLLPLKPSPIVVDIHGSNDACRQGVWFNFIATQYGHNFVLGTKAAQGGAHYAAHSLAVLACTHRHQQHAAQTTS